MRPRQQQAPRFPTESPQLRVRDSIITGKTNSFFGKLLNIELLSSSDAKRLQLLFMPGQNTAFVVECPVARSRPNIFGESQAIGWFLPKGPVVYARTRQDGGQSRAFYEVSDTRLPHQTMTQS